MKKRKQEKCMAIRKHNSFEHSMKQDKTCTKCHTPKPLSEYYIRKSGRVSSICKPCVNKDRHPLLTVWSNMKARCYKTTDRYYDIYGGAGVVVCDEWLNSYKSFFEWAICNGWKAGLHLDKDIVANSIGVEANLYSPDRCQFVTPKENHRNRRSNVRISYNGKTKTVSEWAEITGISFWSIYKRYVEYRWPIEMVFYKGDGRSISKLKERSLNGRFAKKEN